VDEIEEPEESPLEDLVVEVFTAVWGSIVDPESLPMLLWRVGHKNSEEIRRRLGSWVLFNPLLPDGEYRLDLSVQDDREIAKRIMELAMVEEKSLASEKYEGASKAFKSPVSAVKQWAEEDQSIGVLPCEGIWSFCYVTQPCSESTRGESGAKWDARRKISLRMHDTLRDWHLKMKDELVFKKHCALFQATLIEHGVETTASRQWRKLFRKSWPDYKLEG